MNIQEFIEELRCDAKRLRTQDTVWTKNRGNLELLTGEAQGLEDAAGHLEAVLEEDEFSDNPSHDWDGNDGGVNLGAGIHADCR